MGTPQYSPALPYDPAQPQAATTYARPPAPPPVTLNPQPGTELARMLDELELAKAAVTDAEKARDQLIADIKAQGVAAATAINGGTIPAHIRFAGTSARPPWNLDWKIERRFNRDRFDADHPGVYESYRDAKGGWVLGPPR